ncbi:MAG: RNA polymerase sigma factor [Gemmataceae bacterium]
MTWEQIDREMRAARPLVIQRVRTRFGDPQLSEEVAHDCLIAAWMEWRADPCYFVTHSLLAWATQRAYWRALDRLADRARFAPLADEHAADGGDGVKTPEAYPVAREPDAEREQVWGMVHEAVAALPEADQDLVERYHWEGMTDKAIGDLLYGTSDGTAQARGLRVFRQRDRAHGRLRELLLGRGYDPETGQAP